MKRKTQIKISVSVSTFVVFFFGFINFVPSTHFSSKKKNLEKRVGKEIENKMIPVPREKGQNDLIENFATPNLAKSYCYYNLKKGPVLLDLSSGTYYWSIEVLDNSYNSLFHHYEKDVPDETKKVLLVTAQQASLITKSKRDKYDKIVVSRSSKGVAIIRNFIKYWNDENIHSSLQESSCSVTKI